VTVLLMIGGAFLCFEGFEKLAHRFLHSREEDAAHHEELARTLADPAKDPREIERDKIKGAIRTDFVLSAEIIVIALGTIAGSTLAQQVFVLAGVAIAMTVGVYGLVALIVKLDDIGLYLSQRSRATPQRIGTAIVKAAPLLMKVLAVVGTAAMFAVGGGILVHGIAPLHRALESAGVGQVVTLAANIIFGIVAGAVVLGVVSGAQRLLRKR
jgi:hypothetical protein